jgi:hypothetical protein
VCRQKVQHRSLRLAARELRYDAAGVDAGAVRCVGGGTGVHTPRSTLAAWSGRGGAALEPLYETHKRFVLSAGVLHADETPVAMLDPGRGKTKKAYVWAYARGAFDPSAGCDL